MPTVPPRALEGTRHGFTSSTRDTSSSWMRHVATPLLRLLFILAALHLASCEETLSLLPTTSRRNTSGGGANAIVTAAVAGLVRASSSSLEEVHLTLPKAAASGSKALAAATGPSSTRRLSARRLTQALDSSSFTATQIAKLVASDGAAYSDFGISLAIDGDTMVIGAWYRASGSAYVFTRNPGSLTAGWTQRAKLLASDGAGGDYFGVSVALCGDTIVVGAYGDDDKGPTSGSAYIFTRDVAGSLAAGWTQRVKLLASDGAAGDQFGMSVAIDGDTTVIGADHGDGHMGSTSGSAYVFTRDVAGSLSANWVQRAKLLPSDGVVDARFGRRVAIDGDTLVIGSDGDDDKGSKSGSAYVYSRNIAGSLTASWTQRAKLLASDGAAGDYFGVSVALDGDTMVIGAVLDDDKGISSGSVYIYTRDVAGSLTASWTQRAKLRAPDGAAGDRFGYSLDLDGDTMVIGAEHDDDKGSQSGSA
eukprot:CAMPEP_0181370292 /NCGR_PEP_ID=MMETSP1106-20121128/13334_1 /TAXON_ID=81844 /ORGANISM="Mantoniella antarctica, Strain SL-175" /LENGTH=475 /DNA_ID=CAMNT_0023487047 /DNA_START=12 /DNA_END=1436 /DNA_ORIENTATION=+